MLRFVFVLVLMMIGPSIFSGSSEAGEPMKLEHLFQLERLADPQISPDGSRVVYQVTKIHDAAKNEKSTICGSSIAMAAECDNSRIPPSRIATHVGHPTAL